MITRRYVLTALAVTPFFARTAAAASPAVFAMDGIALRGADPVAYFTQSNFVLGTRAHALMWKGAQWRFATVENMAQFEANPEAYAPQFGGYCAYAASKGAIATTVPEAWTIYGGKLYLNHSLTVRGIWSQDVPQNIALAEGHWPQILAL
ncbi:MAG: YHS domain-containing (seleno)protein [Yoonia sp.]|nr:YHS domain-containing (seleno)protein [Yoonia sp.]